jgi:hypothetical protein
MASIRECKINPLLCNRRISKRPFLGNGSVDTPTTIEDLLKAVISVRSAPRLYNVDHRPAELIIERESWESAVQFRSGHLEVSSWQLAAGNWDIIGSWQLWLGIEGTRRVLHGRLGQEDLSVGSWRISTVRSHCQGAADWDTAGCESLAGSVVKCKLWRSAVSLWLLVVPSGVCNWSIHPVSNPYRAYSHTHKACHYWDI